MLTNKECLLMQDLLKPAIKKHREALDNLKNDEREKEENKLISLVSALNKLRHQIDKQSRTISDTHMPKILLVDDAPSMLAVASKLLSEMGFEKIQSAEDADKALKILLSAVESETPIDIVITDWEMEGKSGLDLLKIIRTNELLLETDVFILTSHSEQQNIVQAIEAGVTGYMLKPINFNLLKKKLQDYLPPDEQDTPT